MIIPNLILVQLLLIPATEPARILAYFQIPSASHHFIFRPIMEELAKRGHDILYVTGYAYDKPPKGISQIALPMLNYQDHFKLMNWLEYGELSVPGYLKAVHRVGFEMAHSYLSTKEVQDLIHSDQKFDVVLLETFFVQEYLSAFIHKFNAIGVEIMTFGDVSWLNEMAALPDNPSYQVDYMSYTPNDMTFWQRLYNTYVTAVTTLGHYYYLDQMQALVDRYFNYTGWESRPPLGVLQRNKSLIINSFDYAIGHPNPIPPHRKDIAGINIRPNTPLPSDIQTFMDYSPNDVIYMSLGSHMKASDIEQEIEIFMSVFKNLSQRVMLKFETEYRGVIPPNVKVAKWFPQQDVLAHPKCILFITHGGQQSMTEGTYYGVPMIGIPIFGDQGKNVVFIESAGFGRVLKFRNISRETVSWTINEVLSNKRYKEEASRRSRLLRDRPHLPAEEAAYWIEHSIKYPFALTPQGVNLSPVQLHLIDVKIFISALIFIIVYYCYSIFKFLKTIVNKTRKRKEKDQ